MLLDFSRSAAGALSQGKKPEDGEARPELTQTVDASGTCRDAAVQAAASSMLICPACCRTDPTLTTLLLKQKIRIPAQ
jgi:hypothetical protein